MADERHRTVADDPGEARLRARFRTISAGVILALIGVLVIASVLGPYLSPNFHGIDNAVLATLVGALLLLLGVEVAARLPGSNR